MKTKLTILSLALTGVLLICLFMPLVVSAEESALPIIPTSFNGSIKVNNALAPVGTEIVGNIVDGVGTFTQLPFKLVVAGKFGYADGISTDLSVQTNAEADLGKPIEFYIKLPKWEEAVKANETGIFDSSTHNGFNLTATGGEEDNGGGNGGGGGGGGGSSSSVSHIKSISVNLFGTISSLSINDLGAVQQDFTSASPNGKIGLKIAKGTVVKEANGDLFSGLTGTFNSNPPDLANGHDIIDQAFNFEPSGATFNPPIAMTYHYDSTALPSGVSDTDLIPAYYDSQAAQWVDLPVTADSQNQNLTTQISHFTTSAITDILPAAFTATLKEISAEEVAPGDKVNIIFTVVNTGGKDGVYNGTLLVNGNPAQEQKIAIAAGGSSDLSFTFSQDQPGAYKISLGGAEGSFMITAPEEPSTASGSIAAIESSPEPPATPESLSVPTPAAEQVQPSSNTPLFIGIIVAIIVAAVILFFMWPRRKATHK